MQKNDKLTKGHTKHAINNHCPDERYSLSKYDVIFSGILVSIFRTCFLSLSNYLEDGSGNLLWRVGN